MVGSMLLRACIQYIVALSECLGSAILCRVRGIHSAATSVYALRATSPEVSLLLHHNSAPLHAPQVALAVPCHRPPGGAGGGSAAEAGGCSGGAAAAGARGGSGRDARCCAAHMTGCACAARFWCVNLLCTYAHLLEQPQPAAGGCPHIVHTPTAVAAALQHQMPSRWP